MDVEWRDCNGRLRLSLRDWVPETGSQSPGAEVLNGHGGTRCGPRPGETGDLSESRADDATGGQTGRDVAHERCF